MDTEYITEWNSLIYGLFCWKIPDLIRVQKIEGSKFTNNSIYLLIKKTCYAVFMFRELDTLRYFIIQLHHKFVLSVTVNEMITFFEKNKNNRLYLYK